MSFYELDEKSSSIQQPDGIQIEHTLRLDRLIACKGKHRLDPYLFITG